MDFIVTPRKRIASEQERLRIAKQMNNPEVQFQSCDWGDVNVAFVHVIPEDGQFVVDEQVALKALEATVQALGEEAEVTASLVSGSHGTMKLFHGSGRGYFFSTGSRGFRVSIDVG